MKGRSPSGKWTLPTDNGQSKAKAMKAPEDLPTSVKKPLTGQTLTVFTEGVSFGEDFSKVT
jgi:hypothetical protein